MLSYIKELQQLWKTNQAREHAYRPALANLLNALKPDAESRVVNDPARSEFGAPDFIILKNELSLGHIETKDLGANLDKVETSEQLKRYYGYKNLVLTNYLEFRFFKNGEKTETVSIGYLENGELKFHEENLTSFQNLLRDFLRGVPESIRSGALLAKIMGGKARRIRDNVIFFFEKSSSNNEELEKIYKLMRELLVHDLSVEKFADMYAQTLVYGLFIARYNDSSLDSFTRQEARDLIPASNPFLREFFDHITGSRFDSRLGYIVNELCEVFGVSNVNELVHKHLRILEVADEKDPIIHFYEDFLKEYDPNERKKMGAYYTPLPVVRFIVNQIDDILKKDFGIAKGLADTEKQKYTINAQGQKLKVDLHRVQILDPAVGTATFLNEVIKKIYNDNFKGQEGRWPSYVERDLLPRLFGFEIMMAPYTIAHLKLGMTLQETGVRNLMERLGVYLTNTLEEGDKKQPDLFSIGLADAVSKESTDAAKIKHEKPIMVVIGNPPYSGVSSNETEYANRIIEKYKVEPNGLQKLQERKHWLNDDYVKFIAFAEDMIEKNGEGVIGMITNNGYLDNPTFRGMRWHLTRTFDKIYILDLHGNAKKKECSPDGSKDENVFDIMQGVSIIIAVKSSKKTNPAKVYYSELYGKRSDKFTKLNDDYNKFDEIKLDAKMYYFVPKNTKGKDKYDRGIAINELMPINSTGIVTMGDNFIIDEHPEVIAERVENLSQNHYTENDLNNQFELGKNYAKYVLSNVRDLKFEEKKIVPLAYRPFDKRYTYFDNKVIWRWREKVMKNFLAQSERERERERGERRDDI